MNIHTLYRNAPVKPIRFGSDSAAQLSPEAVNRLRKLPLAYFTPENNDDNGRINYVYTATFENQSNPSERLEYSYDESRPPKRKLVYIKGRERTEYELGSDFSLNNASREDTEKLSNCILAFKPFRDAFAW